MFPPVCIHGRPEGIGPRLEYRTRPILASLRTAPARVWLSGFANAQYGPAHDALSRRCDVRNISIAAPQDAVLGMVLLGSATSLPEGGIGYLLGGIALAARLVREPRTTPAARGPA